MFGEQGKDRRQSYSFKQHFQRAMATKGLRRLLAPMVGTAIVASVAFAYCGADGITGPSGGSSKTPTAPISANTSGGGTGGGGGTIVTPFPVTEEEIPTELAGVDVPTTMQATACNGDVVAWEEARTRASGVMYFNPRTLRTRTVIRIKQTAQGPGTRHATEPSFPQRWYHGYEEYEKETLFAPGVTEVEEEFELRINGHTHGKGDYCSGSTSNYPDDYKLRLRVVISIRNGVFSIRSSTYEKCY